LLAVGSVMRRYSLMSVRLRSEETHAAPRRTPFVFVGTPHRPEPIHHRGLKPDHALVPLVGPASTATLPSGSVRAIASNASTLIATRTMASAGPTAAWPWSSQGRSNATHHPAQKQDDDGEKRRHCQPPATKPA
jgi:hypothetical protein